LTISGIPLLQAKHQRLYGHRKDYQVYIQSTPLLVPSWSCVSQQEEANYYANVEKVITTKLSQHSQQQQQQVSEKEAANK